MAPRAGDIRQTPLHHVGNGFIHRGTNKTPFCIVGSLEKEKDAERLCVLWNAAIERESEAVLPVTPASV